MIKRKPKAIKESKVDKIAKLLEENVTGLFDREPNAPSKEAILKLAEKIDKA